ncbi:hypothetical protein GCK32_011749 [Trichostrongylus colubriformis]|uniref:Uncharacterized protein n=1 Tax=Trichostrongylus colubriformis TaxID=6319 RepID=A0AAN8FXN8_TRICO
MVGKFKKPVKKHISGEYVSSSRQQIQTSPKVKPESKSLCLSRVTQLIASTTAKLAREHMYEDNGNFDDYFNSVSPLQDNLGIDINTEDIDKFMPSSTNGNIVDNSLRQNNDSSPFIPKSLEDSPRPCSSEYNSPFTKPTNNERKGLHLYVRHLLKLKTRSQLAVRRYGVQNMSDKMERPLPGVSEEMKLNEFFSRQRKANY